MLQKLLLRFAAMLGLSRPMLSREGAPNAGFWTFLNDRDWSRNSGGDLDKALRAFVRLKETYGDQFTVVVKDLQQAGQPAEDGTPMAQIQIRVYLSPRNEVIEQELRSLGLAYVETKSR